MRLWCLISIKLTFRAENYNSTQQSGRKGIIKPYYVTFLKTFMLRLSGVLFTDY